MGALYPTCGHVSWGRLQWTALHALCVSIRCYQSGGAFVSKRSEVEQQFETEWAAQFTSVGLPVEDREGFVALLEEAENEARSRADDILQPSLCLLEFGLEWLAYAHVALNEAIFQDKNRAAELEHCRAPWALIGAAVSFGASLRKLCIAGHDTPARALLRTFVETLFLCLAVMHDKQLGLNYLSAETDQQVKDFWHTSASPRNLHARIVAIESTGGLSSDESAQMVAWRRQEYEILSQASHLSYTAAILTVFPSIRSDGSDTARATGIFGLSTDLSLRTLSYAAATTWYFSRFSYSKLIGRSSESLLMLAKNDEWQKRIILGREALSAVTLKRWGEMFVGENGD